MKERGAVLGIEGGGTKTTWVLLGPGGRVLSKGEEGPGNVLQVGTEGLKKVFRGISSALPCPPSAIGGGFAGARGARELAQIRSAMSSVWTKTKKLAVGQDVDSALTAAWGSGDGFLVIAGTGSHVEIGRAHV